MTLRHLAIGLVAGSLCIAGNTVANPVTDPVKEAEDALAKRDYPAAMKILSAAYDAGNQAAGSKLIDVYFYGPEQVRDRNKACAIARTLSEQPKPSAAASRALCLAAGIEASDDPYRQAREWARKAMAAGDAAGGHVLFVIFQSDPKYQYASGGKVDEAKYQKLASLPLSERGEQIEALEGLGHAMAKGYKLSTLTAIPYLARHSAPVNVDRILVLGSAMETLGTHAAVKNYISLAKEIKSYGRTNASIAAYIDAYKAALAAAMTEYKRSGKDTCQEMKMRSATAGDIKDAEYLPVKDEFLRNTYLIKGQWEESWKFGGCGKEIPVTLAFTADGWGGARFKATLAAVKP